jgi:preprotein translocase subunit SecG
MNILYYVTIALHIFACFFLIGVVLLQQGKGQDLASAFGGGGSQAAFGPRGSANILSRATTILAVVFMITSLSLSMLRPREASILDQVQETPAAGAPAATVPAAPVETLPAESSETAPPVEGGAPATETAPEQ